MGFLDLLALTTRIPLPKRHYSISEAGRSSHYLPIVGLIEGSILALVFSVASSVGADVAAVSVLAAHLLVTGGIHLDGFIDYIDVVVSGRRGRQAENILRDPHVGGLAVAWTLVLLLLRYTTLLHLTVHEIVLAYVVARESIYIAAKSARRTRGKGMGHEFIVAGKEASQLKINIICLGLSMSPILLYKPLITAETLVAVAVAAVVSLLVVSDSESRLGYVSGDVLGFTYELSLTIVQLLLVVLKP